MKGLLVLTALLLVAAGLVKLRAAERVGLGVAVLPLVEILAGFGLGGVALSRPPTPLGGLVMILVAVSLIVVSSLQVGLAMGARRRQRARSETTRFRTFMALRDATPTRREGGPRSAGATDRPGGRTSAPEQRPARDS